MPNKVNTYDELVARGFVKQETGLVGGKSALREKLAAGTPVTFYTGYDPTADSCHVGHLMPIMAMAHLQRGGHVPIALMGGGTAMIGDPSGKTEMRQMLSQETIEENSKGLLAQFKRYLKFGKGAGMFVNNADWLLHVGYIDFLREIGKYFRVNEMIKAEAYRARLERESGLSFIEFNYQLLQAYDFLTLYDKHHCTLQVGGDDQWSNMLAGSDLIRRMRQGEAFVLTLPLLTTATGQKMGKTEAGAVWLDAAKTSPYEFYQYWINTDDRDVEKFLKLFTFLPLGEITSLCAKGGAALRTAKEVLAFEVTRITHGDEEAEKARAASRNLFVHGGVRAGTGADVGGSSDIPTTELSSKEAKTMKIADLLIRVGFAPSKAAAARLIKAGGVSMDDQLIADPAAVVTSLPTKKSLLLRKGKKTYHKVVVR